MKQFLTNLADVLDGFAALASVGAIWSMFHYWPTIGSDPEFMQVGLGAMMLAVIPYCLAGAVSRIANRIS